MTNNQKAAPLRELALETIIEVLEKGGYSHKAIRAMLEKYQYLDKRDRSFLTRLCEGTIEHAIELDYIINQFSKVKVNKQKPVIRCILRMGVYQIKYMDGVIDSAACNESVKLAKKKGFVNLSGFVNGVLRNIARSLDQIQYPDQQKQPMEYLSVVYSMPEWIVKKWVKAYGFDVTKGILEAFVADKPTTIRTNLNQCSVEELEAMLKEESVTVEAADYIPYALKISDYNYMRKIEAFRKGLFQIQDESSMLVAEVAGVKEGDYVIDVCAAPGGKSLHLAQKLNGTGTVDARDLTYEKVSMIEENCRRLGFENVVIKEQDALILDPASVEKADVVIADLPCSGLGVIGKKTDIKYKMSEGQQKELVKLQRDILDVVVQYVKQGGTLIYSTCTINKEENEDTMNWLVKEKGFELESIEPYIDKKLWNVTTKEGYLQLLPGIHSTDGFFLSRLIKK